MVVEIMRILSTLGSKSSLLGDNLSPEDLRLNGQLELPQELENTRVDVWKHTEVRVCRVALWLVSSLLKRPEWGESQSFECRLPGQSFGGIPGPAAWPPLPAASTTGVVLLTVGDRPPNGLPRYR